MSTHLMDVHTLQERLGDSKLVIFDTRFNLQDPAQGKRDYDAQHIPGAFFLDLDRDLSASPRPDGVGGRHPLPEMGRFISTLEAAGVGNSSHCVIYDQNNGMFAGRLWFMLRYLGLSEVTLLNGGFDSWLAEGYPTDTLRPTATQGHLIPDIKHHMLADIHEVEAAIANPDILLLDARSPQRYRGDYEPLDSRGGHIPSALNIPFTDNLAGHHFKTKAELKESFSPLEGAQTLICYCGSGVSANHNILALAEAGFDNTKLYVGSWSEWSSDPKRQAETG